MLKEIYNYRQMIYSLVKKDLRGRYKGSILGFLWTFINPLLQLVIYTIVFSVIMRAGYEQYYLFLFVALIPWIFFQTSVQDGSTSILREKDMIKKIYFPRAVMPIATVTSGLVNMLLTFIVIFIVCIFSGRGLNMLALLALPIVVAVQYILCLGVAMIVSALTVYFRDLQYILGILTMGLQYISPVMYDIKIVPERIQPLFNLNPMTHILNIYRQIFYYKHFPDLTTLLYALAFGVGSIIIGGLLFNKMQKGFAENF